jgi:hypothetical protein
MKSELMLIFTTIRGFSVTALIIMFPGNLVYITRQCLMNEHLCVGCVNCVLIFSFIIMHPIKYDALKKVYHINNIGCTAYRL